MHQDIAVLGRQHRGRMSTKCVIVTQNRLFWWAGLMGEWLGKEAGVTNTDDVERKGQPLCACLSALMLSQLQNCKGVGRGSRRGCARAGI